MNEMDEQTMQPRSREPKTPPKIEAAQFVPDPALDSLYRQAVAVAKEFGWPPPERAAFEQRYYQEMAGKIQQ